MVLNVDRPTHVGSRPVLVLTAGLWACVWLVFTVRSYFQVDDFWPLALARLFNVFIGGALSWAIYLFLRSQSHRRFVVLLVEGLILSMTAAVIFGVMSQGVIELITRPPPEPGQSYVDVLLDRTQASPWVFLAWCCGFLALDYNERLRTNELRLVELAALAADAENRMLRYQIQPHFLFNTLTALSTLILDKENERAERMVMALSRFLRHSLVRSPEDRIALRGEVEAQEQYLGIEQERFGERLRFEKAIEPDAERLLVPSLILQPLIENAVKYAVAASSAPTTIELVARRVGDRLEVSVRDDGRAGGEVASGLGVGLTNVRRRLAVAYGERAEFEHGPRPEGGYMARMCIPAETA
ncbi:MAG: histidine kinase [Caulobacteraceae bacterium]|nr:histidine kinase [Caulobacteraceae bacterium]